MIFKDISVELNISYQTVRAHFRDIRNILQVNSSIDILKKIYPDGGDINNLKLTPRGKKVFYLMLENMYIEDIAHHLNISVSAVKRHRENMFLNNNCSSVFQLIGIFYGNVRK